MSEKLSVLTIGHSNHSIEAFLALLHAHDVTALADVRSVPFSRFAPQFNRDALEASLRADGVKYVFLGRELGGRSNDPSCYANGRVQYARLAATNLFAKGIDRIFKGASEHRIALMCAEKDPLDCHRTILVSRALVERDIAVGHILSDGRLEAHGDAMIRLLDSFGLPRDDLFRSRNELIAEALAKQEERVAYIDEGLSNESTEKVP
jgi:uncharacterized protein (DUF488 family)